MTFETHPKTLKLNPRLAKIAELLPRCKSIADIGTDHAYIPIYALLNGLADTAIASDINRGPIDRARENAKAYGLDNKLSLRLGAGLTTLLPNDAEVIVIAGMGGILIGDILKNSPEVVGTAKHLILQPMTAVRELRQYLCGESFTIEKEVLAAEEDKIYNILCVSVGGSTHYSARELILGKNLDKTSPILYDRYLLGIEKKLKTRLAGLKSSALPENQELAKIVEDELCLIGNH